MLAFSSRTEAAAAPAAGSNEKNVPSSSRTETLNPIRTIAGKWAEAVKNRDGKAQYDLLSPKCQSAVHDEYSSNGWSTGTSSPWVESYEISADKNSAAVTYRYATSTGFAGSYEQTLSFVEQNGKYSIDSFSEPEPIDTAPSEEKLKEYQEIQNSVDNGHFPGQLDPEEVARDFALTTLKITDFSKICDKIEKNVTGDRATIVFKKDGEPVMEMELNQPVKKGTAGIWAVASWTDSGTNTKHAVE